MVPTIVGAVLVTAVLIVYMLGPTATRWAVTGTYRRYW